MLPEIWDVLDGYGNPTGRTVLRRQVVIGGALKDGEYHLIVDVWIKNAAGEYLISRRSPFKEPEAGRWEPTCGCAVSGDSSLQAALREVREELGLELEPSTGAMIKRVVNDAGHYMVDVWLFHQEADIDCVTLQPGETDAARWASREEIIAMQREGSFIRPHRIPYLDELP